MNERISVAISGVDGNTNYHIICDRPDVALDFLRKHDHEGSSVNIDILYDDCAAGYRALERLIMDGAK